MYRIPLSLLLIAATAPGCNSFDPGAVREFQSDNQFYTQADERFGEKTKVFVNVSIGEGVRVDRNHQDRFKGSINALVESIASSMPGVTVVMRKNMDVLLQELEFQQSGMTRGPSARIGQMENPKYMVNAEFTNLLYDSRASRSLGSDYKNILKAEIQLTLVEMESARYLYNRVVSGIKVVRTDEAPADADTFRLMMSEILEENLDDLKATFMATVPVVGRVEATRGDREYARIDLGAPERIEEGMEFRVFIKQTLPGGRLSQKEIGELEVVQVMGDGSWAEFSGDKDSLLVGAKVELKK